IDNLSITFALSRTAARKPSARVLFISSSFVASDFSDIRVFSGEMRPAQRFPVLRQSAMNCSNFFEAGAGNFSTVPHFLPDSSHFQAPHVTLAVLAFSVASESRFH